MKQWTFKAFCVLVKRNGYSLSRIKGDHYIYKNAKGKHISVPLRLESVIAKRLIKENHLIN